MDNIILQGIIVQTQDETEISPNEIAGYYFDIIQQHSISVQSEMTDNWMEKNVCISDHIANQPLTISLKGICGEIVYIKNNFEINLPEKQNLRKEKLEVLTVLLPEVDNLTQMYKNAKGYIDASVARYKKVVNNFNKPDLNNEDKEENLMVSKNYYTKLQRVYNDLDNMRLNKRAFIVDTPFKTFENMYIQSLTFSQGDALHVADIEITFKQLYFTETLTTSVVRNVQSECTAQQTAPVEEKGKKLGVLDKAKSIANSLFSRHGRKK